MEACACDRTPRITKTAYHGAGTYVSLDKRQQCWRISASNEFYPTNSSLAIVHPKNPLVMLLSLMTENVTK